MKRGKLQIKKIDSHFGGNQGYYCFIHLLLFVPFILPLPKKKKKSQIATHCFTVFAVRCIGTMLKIGFPNITLPGRLCSWIYPEIHGNLGLKELH